MNQKGLVPILLVGVVILAIAGVLIGGLFLKFNKDSKLKEAKNKGNVQYTQEDKTASSSATSSISPYNIGAITKETGKFFKLA